MQGISCSWIACLQQLGHTIVTEDAEITKVMESLVADNEALKRDTAELQNLLVEAREDVRSLREEVEESKANVSSIPEGTSSIHVMGSWILNCAASNV